MARRDLAQVGLAFLTTLDKIELSSEDGAARSWIQVGKVGTFVNSQYGDIAITRDDLARMLANFKSEYPQAPYQIPIDYDHLSTKKDRKPGDGVAAGWFVDMELRSDGAELWAEIEWTPPAATKIRNREYRYCSPTFFRQWATNTGKQIGTTLVAAALTNFPFLNMQAITLSNEDLTALIAQPRKGSVSMKTITVKDKDGKDVEVQFEGISLDVLSQIPAVAELQAKVPKDGQQTVKAEDLTAMNTKIVELSNTVQGLQTKATEAETRAKTAEKTIRETKLAGLKRTGKIDGADETYGKSLIEMENGAALFDQWHDAMDKRAPKIRVGVEHGAGGGGDEGVSLSQQFLDKVTAYEKEHKVDRRAAINALQFEHPDLAKAYREDAPDYQTARPIKNVVPVQR